ncbi:M56 family metallopeptidase [Kitasatospora sp. NPDC002227]|uniref:M56 family metallopeptidase n=1 Tax=Kitasatospora sp. NPDC002227 TaxID=3154773 RepID=UPI003320849A
MIGSLALAGYAALIGCAVPGRLARARWVQRAPRTAVVLWQALMVSFVVSLALAWYHLPASGRHLHGLLGGAAEWFDHADDGPAPHGAEGPGVLVPIALTALWPAAWFAGVSLQAHRRRRRHAELLDLVGRPAPELRAVVLDHEVPAAYCLPGRRPRVVLTSGAVQGLTSAQLQAVLAHERAHLTGHHHLATAAAEGFARAFPRLPLSRAARESTAELLEMICDDRALRSSSPRALADAMCEVAAGGVPRAAFAAGSAAVLTRLRRLLHPSAPLHPALRCGILLLGLAAAALPYFMTCGPVVG